MSAAAAKKSNDKQTPPVESDRSAAVLLLATAADTTWRMFVPTLGGTIVGLWLDHQWHTAPWFGIGGLALGIVVTAFLIRQQYMKVDK